MNEIICTFRKEKEHEILNLGGYSRKRFDRRSEAKRIAHDNRYKYEKIITRPIEKCDNR